MIRLIYCKWKEIGNVNRGQLDLVGSTDTAIHVGTCSRSQEAGNEAATVSVTVDLHLLAGLADGLEVLVLCLNRSDVDIIVVQRRGIRRAAAEVCEHHIIGTTVRRDSADTGGCAS